MKIAMVTLSTQHCHHSVIIALLATLSHVMLMDPWWNPAVEAQAMDRIHRLGQVGQSQIFEATRTGGDARQQLKYGTRQPYHCFLCC